ncbi:hypothetical protein AJ87_23670 [Rhizobium yanglingense]|nr:hypothetical protein AJ87_23670 [Rhizobium yanglingense]
MKSSAEALHEEATRRPNGTPAEVFFAFLKLGLTSFAGPIARLGYFRDELVVRRRWIDEAGYAFFRARLKSGWVRARPPAGRPAWLIRRLGRVHVAICGATGGFCNGGDGI